MKKLFSILIALVMVFSVVFVLTACDPTVQDGQLIYRDVEFSSSLDPLNLASNSFTAANWNVCMVTDYGDITDQSFNQTTYEGTKAFCDKYGITFSYAKPASNSTAARKTAVKAKISAGANVIVMPGYAFGETIYDLAEEYPNVYFIALDVSASDLTDTLEEGEVWKLPTNVFCAVYQEELCGYMAGYAAVKDGYRKLGFLGGMAVPAVVRYGYGFVQGANAAAVELDVNISIEYVYSGTFWSLPEITAVMDTWYGVKGVEVVFACGGSVYGSACEAADKVGGKVIGVDVDQSGTINSTYTDMCITSAMKGLSPTVQSVLAELVTGNWSKFGGAVCTLGLVSGTDVESNFVQLPIASTSWLMTSFTVANYKTLVGKIYSGEVVVSNDITARPAVNAKVTITYHDNIQ